MAAANSKKGLHGGGPATTYLVAGTKHQWGNLQALVGLVQAITLDGPHERTVDHLMASVDTLLEQVDLRARGKV